MKKKICLLALSLVMLLCPLVMVGCETGYTVDVTNIVGVWEVDDNGGASYITRIEFRTGQNASQGDFTYYEFNGSVPKYGSWSIRADRKYNIIPSSSGPSSNPYVGTLENGKLKLQPDEHTTIYFHKTRD